MRQRHVDLLKEFEQDSLTRNLGVRTIANYVRDARRFLVFLESRNLSIERADKRICVEFVQELRTRDIAEKTIGYTLTAVSSFFEYLVFGEVVATNPIPGVRKRYLNIRQMKSEQTESRRRVPSLDEMKHLVRLIPDLRDQAIILLLAKTGIRLKELLAMDLDDIDWETGIIHLKPQRKRTNTIVYIDEETRRVLLRWVRVRGRMIHDPNELALFTNQRRGRICRNGVPDLVKKWAEKAGLHDPNSRLLDDRLTPHCFRHWFTTQMLEAGMSREYVKELRGDARVEMVDHYNHIDRERLRQDYLARVPRLLC